MMTSMVKMSLLSLKIAVTSLLLFTSINAIAARCIDVFPTVLSSSSNGGKAVFERNVVLSGTNGNIDIRIQSDATTDSNPSCISQKCADSTRRSEALDLPSFMTSSSTQEETLNNGETRSLPQGTYKKIKLNYQATVRFTKNSSVTFVKDLNANNTDTTIIFEEGVYWIETFHIGFNSKVIINGNDKVTLIIKNTHFNKVDTSFNINGTPEQLVLITYNDVNFGYNAGFKGFIYVGENADEKVKLANDSIFIGAINGKEIKLKHKAAITYAPDSIKSANFNGFCSIDDSILPVPVPKLEYRFDECSYTELVGDVIDQTGNFSGKSNDIPDPIGDAKINTSLDLSADGISDWVGVPSSTVNGLNNFSVSVWFKTSESKRLQEIFHALGESTGDDELEIYLKYQKTVVITVGDNPQELESDVELTNGDWHHLALTRVDKKVCLFIDGISKGCENGVESGRLSVTNPNAVVIGQEQDRFGGGFSKSQNFEGQLDEFKIFDEKLSSTQIASIFNNERAGRNYDDPVNERAPEFCSIPIPELEYRFDEVSWNGTANEVNNNLSHGPDGQAYGNATTTQNTEGQICRAGNFGGSGAYIDVSGINEYLKDSASLSFWIKTSQPGNNTAWQAPGILGVEQIGTGNDIFWGYLDGSGRIGIKKGNGAAAVSSGNVNDNEWHHVVLTRNIDDNVVEVFVDGVRGPNGRVQSESGVVSTTFSSIGRIENRDQNNNDNNGISKYFIGQLDELLVYNSVLSQSDVSFIYDNQNNKMNYDGSKDRFCPTEPSKIDHFEIEHDGYGLTCDAESIRIKVCTDAICSEGNLSTESVTLDVLAGGSIISSPTFTGSKEVSFNHTTAETLTFTIANSNTTPLNSLKCNGSTGSACDIKFEKAGFRFLYDNKRNIPPQVSGSVFGETLTLQAVKDSHGVCKGMFTGVVNVNLSQKNLTPDNTNPGLSFQINTDTNIAKNPAYTSDVSLNFGAGSIAEIRTPRYNDAGEISLHASYTVAIEEGKEGSEFNGVSLFGSSKPFWVRPFELVVSATSGGDNLDGSAAKADPTHTAGESFDLTVTAYNYNKNNNKRGDITPNYKPGQIELKLMRTGPILTDSVDGDFNYAVARSLKSSTSPAFANAKLTNFVLGVSTYNAAKYSEVGLVNLDVQDSNYGGANIVVGAKDINIGRFIPDHFKQTVVDDGNLFATCGTNPPFAYSGEKDEAISSIGAISYLANPILVITAYNKKGISTKNYNGEFMKLRATDVIVAAPSFDQDARGIDNKILSLTTNDDNNNYMKTGTLTQSSGGVLHYQFSNNDNFYYNRTANALVAPFTSDIDFSIDTIIDSDSVDLIPSDSSLLPTTVVAHPEGVQIRFGRLVLKNSVGPETSNLTQPLQVEHFDGDHFIVSSDNNCLSYDDENIILDDSAPTVALGDDGHFIAGETRAIQLQAPGVKGDIDVEYEAYDWLKYDWNNDGVYNNNPTAVATFGFFRGNDRVIYRRRVYN